MRSSSDSACLPSSAISPPLQSVDLSFVLARIVVLANCNQLSVLDQQTSITSRIDGGKSGNRDRCAIAQRSAQSLQGLCAPPAACRQTPPVYRQSRAQGLCRAASTAWAVPSRCICRAISARENQPQSLLLDRIMIGPITTAQACAPASRTARSTCSRSDCPPIVCITFGRAERMRVPSPPPAPPRRSPVRHYYVRSRLLSAAVWREPRRKAIRYRRQTRGCPPLLLTFRPANSFKEQDAEATDIPIDDESDPSSAT